MTKKRWRKEHLTKGWFWRMFPRNENRNEGTFGCSPGTKSRNEGTFACSPGTKTGTRVHSPKPPFYETALLSPGEPLQLPPRVSTSGIRPSPERCHPHPNKNDHSFRAIFPGIVLTGSTCQTKRAPGKGDFSRNYSLENVVVASK